jgi:hypothetical protein
MENLQILTAILFILTTALLVIFFYKASNMSKTGLLIMLAWILLQSIISISGFYQKNSTTPPRIIFLILPPIIFIIILFASGRGRQFINQLNPGMLTLLHIVRIPVEIVLYGLFLEKEVPRLMTFAGGNYDIVSGLTAPLIYYFGFVKKTFSRWTLLIWNIICLCLLFSIVFHAVLSAPSAFQQYAFNQPNVAILHFPYTLLPAFIVPVVLFSHLAGIRYLYLHRFGHQAYQKRTVAQQ